MNIVKLLSRFYDLNLDRLSNSTKVYFLKNKICRTFFVNTAESYFLSQLEIVNDVTKEILRRNLIETR